MLTVSCNSVSTLIQSPKSRWFAKCLLFAFAFVSPSRAFVCTYQRMWLVRVTSSVVSRWRCKRLHLLSVFRVVFVIHNGLKARCNLIFFVHSFSLLKTFVVAELFSKHSLINVVSFAVLLLMHITPSHIPTYIPGLDLPPHT